MKHKETFFIIVLFVICIMLMFGCSSTRRSVENTERIEISEQSSNLAKDEIVIDYSIDTTKECEQTISYEFIEYYPDIDTSTNVQAIKYVTKKKVTTKKTDSGKTAVKKDSISYVTNYSDINIKNDSRKVSEKSGNGKEIYLWLLFLLIAIATIFFIILRINK